jgi:hypothetical protein
MVRSPLTCGLDPRVRAYLTHQLNNANPTMINAIPADRYSQTSGELPLQRLSLAVQAVSSQDGFTTAARKGKSRIDNM